MKHNVGTADRIVRVAIAIALFSLYFVLDGDLRYAAVLGILPLMTVAMGWCPLYAVLGIGTACNACQTCETVEK